MCICHKGWNRCWCENDGVPVGDLPVTDEQKPKKKWDYDGKGSYKDRLIDI